MQFRLVYRGQLPPARWEEDTRRKEKHLIRKELHKQLKELWKVHPLLENWASMLLTAHRCQPTRLLHVRS